MATGELEWSCPMLGLVYGTFFKGTQKEKEKTHSYELYEFFGFKMLVFGGAFS